jgi:hypothetical protein
MPFASAWSRKASLFRRNQKVALVALLTITTVLSACDNPHLRKWLFEGNTTYCVRASDAELLKLTSEYWYEYWYSPPAAKLRESAGIRTDVSSDFELIYRHRSGENFTYTSERGASTSYQAVIKVSQNNEEVAKIKYERDCYRRTDTGQ